MTKNCLLSSRKEICDQRTPRESCESFLSKDIISDWEEEKTNLKHDNTEEYMGNSLLIRVYSCCPVPQLEYKTVSIKPKTTSRELIKGLLSKLKQRCRDPRLFYLTMDVLVNQTSRTIILKDNSKPMEMLSCNPWIESRFILRCKQGTLLRIHDHLLRQDSVYRTVIIARITTVGEVLNMLWGSYSRLLCLVETYPEMDTETILDWDQSPVEVMETWKTESQKIFVVKKVAEIEIRLSPTIEIQVNEDFDDDLSESSEEFMSTSGEEDEIIENGSVVMKSFFT